MDSYSYKILTIFKMNQNTKYFAKMNNTSTYYINNTNKLFLVIEGHTPKQENSENNNHCNFIPNNFYFELILRICN
jgi:hypothetical protein